MAIRFANMTLWQRDWFLSLDGKYQLFVHYLRDHCDHAGVWQPAFRLYEKITGFRIDVEEFLRTVNAESARVCVLENGKWWLTGFIEDQYKTREISDKINPHKGVINSIRFNNVPYESHGYTITLRNTTDAVKEQDAPQEESAPAEIRHHWLIEHWQASAGLTKHRTITPRMEDAAKRVSSTHPKEDLIACVDNYSKIMISTNDYFGKYSHGFEDFFRRGANKPAPFEKFLPERDPLNRLLKNGRQNTLSSRERQAQKEYTYDYSDMPVFKYEGAK
jgi:hypothetical protein